jgi:hypothetical protein
MRLVTITHFIADNVRSNPLMQEWDAWGWQLWHGCYAAWWDRIGKHDRWNEHTGR